MLAFQIIGIIVSILLLILGGVAASVIFCEEVLPKWKPRAEALLHDDKKELIRQRNLIDIKLAKLED